MIYNDRYFGTRLLWALMASGQITMRKVDGWKTLSQIVSDAKLDQAA